MAAGVGTERGMAVLLIALRIGRKLEPPFPPDIEQAVTMLAAQLKKKRNRQT